MPLELSPQNPNGKITVHFTVSIQNVPEENKDKLKLEINYCLLQLAKKHSPEDILVNLSWF